MTEYEKFVKEINDLGNKIKKESGKGYNIYDLKAFAELNAEMTKARAAAYFAEKEDKKGNINGLYEFQFIVNSANEFANILTANSIIYEMLKRRAEDSKGTPEELSNVVFTSTGPLFTKADLGGYHPCYIEAAASNLANFNNSKGYAMAMIDEVAEPFFVKDRNRIYCSMASKNLEFRINTVIIGKRFSYDSKTGKPSFERVYGDPKQEIAREKVRFLAQNSRMEKLVMDLFHE